MRYLLWIPFEFRCSYHFRFHRSFQQLGPLVPVRGTLNASPKTFWITSNFDEGSFLFQQKYMDGGFGVTGLCRVLISSPKEHLWGKSEQRLSAMAISSNIGV